MFAAIVALLALARPDAVFAQTTPDAGSTLRETTPAPTLIPHTPDLSPPPAPTGAPGKVASGGASFILNGLRFNGNTVIPTDELQAIVAGYIGSAVTLADLETIAQLVTEKYRRAGYLLAEAIVPVQEVKDGQVEISVIEGVLGRVRLELDPDAPMHAEIVEGILSRLETGKPLSSAVLERVMLLLSDLPGVSPQAALEQGDAAGTTDLIISITPRRQWDLSIDADNHGSGATSEFRVGLLGRIGSPLRRGDNLDARVQLGAGGRLAYGRLSYELPVGDDGTRLGAAFSSLEYELGKEFSVLDGSGRAHQFELSLTHPFIRARARNLFGRFGWLTKQLDDRLDLIGQRTDKTITSAYAGLVYEQRDQLLGGGYTSAGLTAFFGRLSLDAEARALEAGRQTEGHYQHWNYSLSRLNALASNTNLFFGIVGQFADRNLDSAEKVALGGPRGVRAYGPAEASVDEGHVANLELRFSVTPELSMYGFYDWGWGRYDRKPVPGAGDNRVSLRGFGLGTFWGSQDGMVLRASLAWRDTTRGVVDTDRVPRLYMQVSKSF